MLRKKKVLLPLVQIKSDTMMSQNLAAHNSYQHLDSLVMSWNASLQPRPDAVAPGHTGWCSCTYIQTHTYTPKGMGVYVW